MKSYSIADLMIIWGFLFYGVQIVVFLKISTLCQEKFIIILNFMTDKTV